MQRINTRFPVRSGFTLVEMLVVVALIVLLASLVVAVMNSGAYTSQRVIAASDRASGWLLMAKQRAMRDGAPRGVRFLFSPSPVNANEMQGREAQFIETPDPWIPNPKQELNPTGPRIVFVYQTKTVPVAGVNTTFTIQPGDTTVGHPEYQFDYPQIYYISDNPSDIAAFNTRAANFDMLILPEIGTLKINNVTTPANSVFTIGSITYDGTNSRRINGPADPTTSVIPWVTNTAYPANSYVTNGGQLYYSQTGQPSTVNFSLQYWRHYSARPDGCWKFGACSSSSTAANLAVANINHLQIWISE